MDSRKARWIALGSSSAVALVLLAAGLYWNANRDRGSVRMNIGERPPLDAGTRTKRAGARSEDPTKPEEWRFHLTEKEADRFFAIAQNTRVLYEPWMALREIPNEAAEMTWREHPDGKFVFRTNSLGCREDHELDAVPRDLRILVAGDSHTCGICNNPESFANRLEASLAADRPTKTVEVLNTGLGGYNLYNYLGALYRFRDFKPQVFVVAIFGGNDFVDFFPLYLHFARKPWPATSAAADKRRREALKISGDAMGQGLATLDNLRSWESEHTEIMNASLQMCLEIRRTAERMNCPVVFVYIPCPFELTWPKPAAHYVKTRDALEFVDADFEMLADLADRVLDGLRAKGIRPIDMRPVFEKEPTPPYWRADFHLNLRGHELIAEALKPVVDELLTRE
jgi:lysophospholipase L1-like esterase